MRFCRRNEGTTSARTVFKRARDDTNASYRKLTLHYAFSSDHSRFFVHVGHETTCALVEMIIFSQYHVIVRPTKMIIYSQIWPALPANFLTLRVWEGTRAIQDDKYLKWQ